MVSPKVQAAIDGLFKAYDLDESGTLSRDEFLAIEMRLNFERGEVFRGPAGAAKMTLADRDYSGALDLEEFTNRILESFAELQFSAEQIVKQVSETTKAALLERAKMGPRYHTGIRATLRRIFSLFDVSGDGRLSPEEWIAAQKAVALEVCDDLDEGWVDEAAFAAADLNGDGMLDIDEFLQASFSMFEGVKTRSDELLNTLERIVKVLESESSEGARKETQQLTVYTQLQERPDFQAPLNAWQDEPTEDDPDRGPATWTARGELALPLSLETADEVASVLRLFLGIPKSSWVSVFFLGPPMKGARRPVTLLRGEKPGEGNVQEALTYLSKPHAEASLYVKNVRQRPAKLTRQPRAFLEERDELMGSRHGQCWGLDWETQLVGAGEKLPPRPLTINVGDALVVEVPINCGDPLDRFVASVYMDKTDVLSKPVDENIVPKVKKKKKKLAAEPDPLQQLSFVCLKEGMCVLFVDISWEDQETGLAKDKKLVRPVRENSVARIGPLEVEVVRPAGRVEASFVWWNGEKWSNKKGPAKKKGKKR